MGMLKKEAYTPLMKDSSQHSTTIATHYLCFVLTACAEYLQYDYIKYEIDGFHQQLL